MAKEQNTTDASEAPRHSALKRLLDATADKFPAKRVHWWDQTAEDAASQGDFKKFNTMLKALDKTTALRALRKQHGKLYRCMVSGAYDSTKRGNGHYDTEGFLEAYRLISEIDSKNVDSSISVAFLILYKRNGRQEDQHYKQVSADYHVEFCRIHNFPNITKSSSVSAVQRLESSAALDTGIIGY